MRSGFQDHMGHTGRLHPGQVALDIRSFWGGYVETGIDRLIPDNRIYSGNHPHGNARGVQDLIDQVTGCCLAIRSRDADHAHLASRIAIQRCGEPGQA